MENEKREKALDILRYWQMIEFLDQPNIPTYKEVQKNSAPGRNDVLVQFSKTPDIRIIQDTITSSIIIELGKINRRIFSEIFYKTFIDPEGKKTEYIPNTYFSVCRLSVDTDGMYSKESFIRPSRLLWAYTVWKSNDAAATGDYSLDLAEYKELQDELSAMILSKADDENDRRVPLSEFLTELWERLCEVLPQELFEIKKLKDGSYSMDKTMKGSYIYTRYSDENAKEADDGIIERYSGGEELFLSEIELVLERTADGSFGSGAYEESVLDYIACGTGNDSFATERRVELSRDTKTPDMTRELLGKVLDIGNAPLGKWPSEYRLAFMQQVAVNIASAEDGKIHGVPIPPLFSLNGPPGSGKTMLLKELVADRVVKKAALLSELDDPDDLFDTRTDTYGKRYYTIKRQYDRVNDHSIIAAAMSNNAAKNISAEMPLMKNAFEKFLGEGDLFSDLACSLFDRKKGGCWGLISVPLGNSGNISAFTEKVLIPLTCEENNNMSRESIERHKELYREEKRKFLEQLGKTEAVMREISRNAQNEQCAALSDFLLPGTDKGSDNVYIAAQSADPWITEEYDTEREKLFYRACTMLKEFLLGSYKALSDLRIYADLQRKKEAADPEVMTGVFPALFLLTPLISVTLASFRFMFGKIRTKGVFGTLIVDEAGQSCPQFAVGALLRARRAFIVGDPKQLPPIVTEDVHIISLLVRRLMLGNNACVPEKYTDKDISVQTFADSINPYGRYIGSEWVGCPLSLHHRCIEPMFSIANTVSYDNTMIIKTGKAPDNRGGKRFILPRSCWITTYEDQGHIEPYGSEYMSEHGSAAIRLLMEAFRKVPPDRVPDVFVISRFVSVVNGIKRDLEAVNYYGQDNIKRWVEEEHIGTVHTFQGKEADEVIFVPGIYRGDIYYDTPIAPSKDFLLNCIDEHIVNVAVTRARYRLYVVGDLERCRNNRHLSVLIEKLRQFQGEVITDDMLNLYLTVRSKKQYGPCPECGAPLAKMFMPAAYEGICTNENCSYGNTGVVQQDLSRTGKCHECGQPLKKLYRYAESILTCFNPSCVRYRSKLGNAWR